MWRMAADWAEPELEVSASPELRSVMPAVNFAGVPYGTEAFARAGTDHKRYGMGHCHYTVTVKNNYASARDRAGVRCLRVVQHAVF